MLAPTNTHAEAATHAMRRSTAQVLQTHCGKLAAQLGTTTATEEGAPEMLLLFAAIHRL